ncbi:hypothetical protein HYN43_002555 [Mucilaginibacter celer]|uniref:Uncharacterized protein n=2 Tax=Mucilaginibacter celer TaxID=2305508 RepID=A0A494VL48_9SPHI|nr:hypothetical protein HYN43_002555 [Mucilaginibacter celer]
MRNKGDVNLIRDGIIKEWISTQTYQLPIVGIKVMASDIQVFGPLILMVASTWLYYEVRREHFTVGRLLGDVYYTQKNLGETTDPKIIIFCQEVYHNLIGYTVFNVVPYDTQISHLGNPLVSMQGINSLTWAHRTRRMVIKVLVMTPLISLGFILLTRILTFTIIESTVTGKVHQISTISGMRLFLLVLSSVLMLISLYVCFINVQKIYKLDNATRKLLDDFQLWAFQGINPAD